ncbi:site-specific integrase, partial [Mesorhizobium sp. M0244]|uniref:site-specific integrase n=1 Tax=Mesorhizobium sp. M0244 TaxID=2956926 RepID=UPI003339BB49
MADYLAYLAAPGWSPTTATAYAHDLRHFWPFLSQAQLAWEAVSGADAIGFLAHLRTVSSRARAIRRGPVGVFARWSDWPLACHDQSRSRRRLVFFGSASPITYGFGLDVFRNRQGMSSSIWLCGWPL